MRRFLSPGFMCFTILAGLPATTHQSGTSFVTTAPAPTTTLLPTVTPPACRMNDFELRSCQMELGQAYSRSFQSLSNMETVRRMLLQEHSSDTHLFVRLPVQKGMDMLE